MNQLAKDTIQQVWWSFLVYLNIFYSNGNSEQTKEEYQCNFCQDEMRFYVWLTRTIVSSIGLIMQIFTKWQHWTKKGDPSFVIFRVSDGQNNRINCIVIRNQNKSISIIRVYSLMSLLAILKHIWSNIVIGSLLHDENGPEWKKSGRIKEFVCTYVNFKVGINWLQVYIYRC